MIFYFVIIIYINEKYSFYFKSVRGSLFWVKYGLLGFENMDLGCLNDMF